MIRTVIITVLALIVGFFLGEALAVIIGITTNQLSDGVPSGPVLWFLRSLPFVCAILCAGTAFIVSRPASR